MLGVHPQTVVEFILGDRAISAEMTTLIGDALGMDDRQWFELQEKIVLARCENTL
jgi:plasmid maintenance system antidote protein VapI